MVKTNGPSPRQQVGPTLRTFREQQGRSLLALAQTTGLSPSHLSRIERGHTVPSYDVLARIAAALDTDLSSLRTEEATTKAVDADLDTILDQLGLSPTARADLLRLAPATRAELATALAPLDGGC
ncbi:MAG TPA: helix-turn-helix transcriptional regulator [Chloroflexota bacterium]|nr:helix-turn-helix transcriptional regulator [Chloroflexota bacterium]